MNMQRKNFIPEKSDFLKNDYVTYRRLWLDACLNAYSDEMRGSVIDLGGKHDNKRGSFRPPEHQANYWWYINLDLNASPDIFADVTQTPLESKTVDRIICTEVLEHLPNPQACVDEIHRLLRNGGVAFVSVPFFYPVHADPYDFQRFTEDGLRHLFRGFNSIEVYRMGSYAGVLGLLIELGIAGVEGNSIFQKILRWKMKWISRWLFRYDLLTFTHPNPVRDKFTTGYFVKAVR
jgi:SAM-dependent methyltransferase